MNAMSLLPPTEKRKQFELRALALRDFAAVASDEALDPFALAEFARLLVVDFDQVKDLSDESREHLLGAGTNEWSGGACSQPLPNGWRLVILNPAHGAHRNRATLMEEISHVFLGHTANRLAVAVADVETSGKKRRKKTGPEAGASPHPDPLPNGEEKKVLARDYNKSDEEAAYAIGSAALVPYATLRKLVLDGLQADQIARRFRVSRQLVEYRIKVTHLWSAYKSLSGSRAQHV
jgi:IrrE N-terminal-like domain